MKRILFVDDDLLVMRIYKEALSRQGFYVEVAHDVVTAAQALRNIQPDLLVLDLMMPQFAGVEVIKFVRSQPELSAMPIIVLSNAYLDDLARDAATTGAQRLLLKVRCTPSILVSVIRELLEGTPPSQDPAHLLAVPNREQATPRPEAPSPLPAASFLLHEVQTGTPHKSVRPPVETGDAEYRDKARQHFLEHATSTCGGLRNNFQAFARAKDKTERDMQLQNLYRQVHFLAASAGLAECYPIARMASVFEAMLFELTEKPALHNPSVLRTCALAIDFFNALFHHARSSKHDAPPSSRVLVVDDDPLSTRLIVSALRHAELQPRSTEDPFIGFQWLRDRPYDLILLDIEMPGMDGFELCKRLRQLPAYQKTPVIYVTGHSDFESRAKSALSGGDDLISKPIFPMELAVKAMTHLLSNQLAIKPMAA